MNSSWSLEMLSTQMLRRERIRLRWGIVKPVVYTSLFWAVRLPVPSCLHATSWNIVQFLTHWQWFFLANTKYLCLEKVECLCTNEKKADRRPGTCSGLLSRAVEAGLESQMLLDGILLHTIARIKDASFSDPVFDWPKVDNWNCPAHPGMGYTYSSKK